MIFLFCYLENILKDRLSKTSGWQFHKWLFGPEKLSERSTNGPQASVVRRVDSAIHWITQLLLLVFIRWIVIYPVDSVIYLLNNRFLGT